MKYRFVKPAPRTTSTLIKRLW